MFAVTLGLQVTSSKWRKHELELPVTLFPSGIVTLRAADTTIHTTRNCRSKLFTVKAAWVHVFLQSLELQVVLNVGVLPSLV